VDNFLAGEVVIMPNNPYIEDMDKHREIISATVREHIFMRDGMGYEPRFTDETAQMAIAMLLAFNPVDEPYPMDKDWANEHTEIVTAFLLECGFTDEFVDGFVVRRNPYETY
jgi:hypothetical protein